VLTPQQVQAAIQEGSKYKTIDQFLAVLSELAG
jgi:hypothetical protein